MSKLIGQGTSACVYRPPISCAGKLGGDPGFVTKVTSSKIAWEDELHMHNAMGSGPGLSEFTVNVAESCQLPVADLPAATRHLLRRTCSSYKDADAANVYLLQLPHGGDTLHRVIQSAPVPDVLQFVRGAQRLFQWLKYSEKANATTQFGHMDIKPDNILVRYGDGGVPEWRLIDFGLALEFHGWSRRGTPAQYYPLDFDAYANKLDPARAFRPHYEWVVDGLNNTARRQMRGTPTPADRELLSLVPTSGDVMAGVDAMERQLATQDKFDVDAASKVDVYMLGQVLFEVVMMVCASSRKPPAKTVEDGIALLRSVVLPMMNPNVFARPNAVQAAAAFETFMKARGYPVNTGNTDGQDVVGPRTVARDHVGAPQQTKTRPVTAPTKQPPTKQPPTKRALTKQPPTKRPPTKRPPTKRPPIKRLPTKRPPTKRPPMKRPPTKRPPTKRPPTKRPPTKRPPVRQANRSKTQKGRHK